MPPRMQEGLNASAEVLTYYYGKNLSTRTQSQTEDNWSVGGTTNLVGIFCRNQILRHLACNRPRLVL